MKKIKVLCVVPNTYIGGMQIATLRLFEKASDSIESHFLLSRWSDEKFTKRLIKLDIPFNYTWFGMFSRKLDWNNLKMSLITLSKLPITWLDFWKVIRSQKSDIIYFSGHREIILLSPFLILYQKPIVFHVHNTIPHSIFHRIIFFLINNFISHYITVSEQVSTSIKSLNINKSKVSLLYNGIDLKEFSYKDKRRNMFIEKFQLPIHSLIIGMTGQMVKEKGHLDFINAAYFIHKKCEAARFIIGGKLEIEFFEEINSLIEKNNLSSQFFFTGWQSNMRSFYENLDIFVLPSSQSTEGFPLVTLEAMAIGLPVIVTKSGGAPEAVIAGKNGLIVEKNSSSQLADAIYSTINLSDRGKSMGKVGRQIVENKFTLDRQSENFIKIISMLNKK